METQWLPARTCCRRAVRTGLHVLLRSTGRFLSVPLLSVLSLQLLSEQAICLAVLPGISSPQDCVTDTSAEAPPLVGGRLEPGRTQGIFQFLPLLLTA